MATMTLQPNELAIGELLAEANPASKEIISAYHHDRNHAKNVQDMSSSKFTAENLEICANFLGLKTRDHENGKIFSNKPTLADRIILKIESHFEAECGACNLTYRNKLADKPLKVCFRCLQGSHDCDDMKNSSNDLTMPGAVWLCNGCYRQFDALAPTKEKKTRKAEATQPSTQQEQTNEPGTNTLEERRNEDTSYDPSENGENDHSHSHLEITNQNDQNRPRNRRQICPKYVKNCCPHGISGTRKINGRKCDKYHPRACPRWLLNGPRRQGCTSRNCKLFHPVLCRYSVRSRRCENLACTYVHISQTKRWPASEDNYEPLENNPGSSSEQAPLGNENITQGDERNGQSQQYQTPAGNQQSPEMTHLTKLITDMRKDFQEELDQLRKQIISHNVYPPWKPPAPAITQPYNNLGQNVQPPVMNNPNASYAATARANANIYQSCSQETTENRYNMQVQPTPQFMF